MSARKFKQFNTQFKKKKKNQPKQRLYAHFQDMWTISPERSPKNRTAQRSVRTAAAWCFLQSSASKNFFLQASPCTSPSPAVWILPSKLVSQVNPSHQVTAAISCACKPSPSNDKQHQCLQSRLGTLFNSAAWCHPHLKPVSPLKYCRNFRDAPFCKSPTS